MADMNKLKALLTDIDDLVGVRREAPLSALPPTSLADRISKEVGLPTFVVEGNAEDTAEQQAVLAAAAAISALVLPPAISHQADEAIITIDSSEVDFL